MRRHSLLLAISFMAFVPSAQAGFEWLPPSQIPASAVIYDAPSPTNAPFDAIGGALLPISVISEPLDRRAPTSILPQRQPVKNLSGTGLFIDPYPLRTQNSNGMTGPIDLGTSSVEQAMIEQAHILNPLPLGVGMKTGAQPTSAIMPTARANGYSKKSLSSGLTPMTGGVLPLPGMANIRQSRPVAAVPIIRYGKVVGFGRNLPLALALSQVIPLDFSHSYADGVDAGATVSWEGGLPWNRVLESMLKPKGLTAAIHGNKIIIQPLARL